MKNTTKFLSLIMVIAMTMTAILPTIVTAAETIDEVNMTNPDVVIDIYDGRHMSSFSELENKCMDYLFNMYKIVPVPTGNTGEFAYGANINKKLFMYEKDPDNPEDYIIRVYPDVTSKDNIIDHPDKKFFIAVNTFGTSDAVPNSITLDFGVLPVGEDVTITLCDGMDIDKLSDLETACMLYLTNTGVLDYREKGDVIYNISNNKDLMYVNYEEDPLILHLCENVTSKDNLEVEVDAYGTQMVQMFQYYNVNEIPGKIKLKFQVENDILKGDLDGNNVIDANDASMALEIFKAENATPEDIAVGDMDDNRLIDANDASLILELYKTNN